MSEESLLSSIVEAAVGMSGIIAALRQGRVTHWPREACILLEVLLIASASAVGFALLPSVLAESGLPQPLIWRLGSLALLAWQVGLGLLFAGLLESETTT